MPLEKIELLDNGCGPDASRKKICILVLGMHRSGTSLVAGVLAQFGMQRPLREMAPHRHNAKGYFEPIDIVEIHDALLKNLGSHWSDVRRLPDGWDDTEGAQIFMAALQQSYNFNYCIPGTAILKDPRICRLLPLWVRIFARIDVQPYALFVTRHPVEVARSLAARDAFDLHHGLLLWLRHVLDAEYQSRSLPRYFVPFDRQGSVEGIARALDLFDLERLRRGIDSHREEEFYDQGLRHHRHGDADASLALAFPWIDRMVDAMSMFEASPVSEEAMLICDDVRREFEQACTAFARMAIPPDIASAPFQTEDAAPANSMKVAYAKSAPPDKPVEQALTGENFDEEFYLRTYPDVASSVAQGDTGRAFEHWTHFGSKEGRLARLREPDAKKDREISS